jgi:hypothetical protein
MSELYSREQIQAEVEQVMGVFARGMKDSVADVFDAGVKSGQATAMREVGFTVETLKANLHNQNLSDSDFRRFVGTIVARLSEQVAG